MSIARDVKRLVAEVGRLDPAEVRDDATLAEYGLDSIRVLDLVTAVERTFAIRIPDETAALLKTVTDVVEHVIHSTRGAGR